MDGEKFEYAIQQGDVFFSRMLIIVQMVAGQLTFSVIRLLTEVSTGFDDLWSEFK